MAGHGMGIRSPSPSAAGLLTPELDCCAILCLKRALDSTMDKLIDREVLSDSPRQHCLSPFADARER
jgi:hypothetical protein